MDAHTTLCNCYEHAALDSLENVAESRLQEHSVIADNSRKRDHGSSTIQLARVSEKKCERIRKAARPTGFVMGGPFIDHQSEAFVVEARTAKDSCQLLHIVDHALIFFGAAGFCRSC